MVTKTRGFVFSLPIPNCIKNNNQSRQAIDQLYCFKMKTGNQENIFLFILVFLSIFAQAKNNNNNWGFGSFPKRRWKSRISSLAMFCFVTIDFQRHLLDFKIHDIVKCRPPPRPKSVSNSIDGRGSKSVDLPRQSDLIQNQNGFILSSFFILPSNFTLIRGWGKKSSSS